MNIEYTNTVQSHKKRLFPTIIMVLGFLLLIPTTLILIGQQNKKDPTGNYLSPLPQGQLSQTIPTPEETIPLSKLISLSQDHLNQATSLSSITPQTQLNKQEIVSQLQKSLDYSNLAVSSYPQNPQAYLLRAQILTSISRTNPEALLLAKSDLQNAEQLNTTGETATSSGEIILSDLLSPSQNLIIASPQQADLSTISIENNSNANMSTIILPAGQTQLEITNPLAATNSYIYIVPQTKTNQVIYVSSRQEGSFILETNKPFDTDISLDYWIINY